MGLSLHDLWLEQDDGLLDGKMMIQWTGAPWLNDATNATATATVGVVTVIPAIATNVDVWTPDDGEREYETFREGTPFRLEQWHMHPWITEPVTRLGPPPMRPRRIEVAGYSRRYTSGFV
jgi:hypothetical protein